MKNARISSHWFMLLLLTGATLGWPEVRAQTNPPTRLTETTVLGTNELREEMPMGENQQPEWTARRRFATTRVYVQPPWQAEVELGWKPTWPRQGQPTHEFTEEIELGLPYRFQVDFENSDMLQNSDWEHAFNAVELRWALAEWGKICMNPTVGLEWKFNHDEADAFEVKIQLGDELAPRWHWGANLFWEQQVGDDREREFAATAALSYTLIDEKFSAGAETKFASESDMGTRDHPEDTVIIGPSFQWRPTRRTHLDVAPLFGVTGHAPLCQLFVFFGFDFGRGSKEPEGLTPTSLRGK